MAVYKKNSPWNDTNIINKQYLGILSIRPIPAEDDDKLYTVEEQYTHRPDLMAYDLYDDQNLWWVFAQRNMDIIKDPVYDIEAGLKIYIPKAANLKRFLGI